MDTSMSGGPEDGSLNSDDKSMGEYENSIVMNFMNRVVLAEGGGNSSMLSHTNVSANAGASAGASLNRYQQNASTNTPSTLSTGGFRPNPTSASANHPASRSVPFPTHTTS